MHNILRNLRSLNSLSAQVGGSLRSAPQDRETEAIEMKIRFSICKSGNIGPTPFQVSVSEILNRLRRICSCADWSDSISEPRTRGDDSKQIFSTLDSDAIGYVFGETRCFISRQSS